MKQDIYTLEYSTKTRRDKLISYGACSLHSAVKLLRKNTRMIRLGRAWKNGKLILPALQAG